MAKQWSLLAYRNSGFARLLHIKEESSCRVRKQHFNSAFVFQQCLSDALPCSIVQFDILTWEPDATEKEILKVCHLLILYHSFFPPISSQPLHIVNSYTCTMRCAPAYKICDRCNEAYKLLLSSRLGRFSTSERKEGWGKEEWKGNKVKSRKLTSAEWGNVHRELLFKSFYSYLNSSNMHQISIGIWKEIGWVALP